MESSFSANEQVADISRCSVIRSCSFSVHLRLLNINTVEKHFQRSPLNNISSRGRGHHHHHPHPAWGPPLLQALFQNKTVCLRRANSRMHGRAPTCFLAHISWRSQKLRGAPPLTNTTTITAEPESGSTGARFLPSRGAETPRRPRRPQRRGARRRKQRAWESRRREQPDGLGSTCAATLSRGCVEHRPSGDGYVCGTGGLRIHQHSKATNNEALSHRGAARAHAPFAAPLVRAASNPFSGIFRVVVGRFGPEPAEQF